MPHKVLTILCTTQDIQFTLSIHLTTTHHNTGTILCLKLQLTTTDSQTRLSNLLKVSLTSQESQWLNSLSELGFLVIVIRRVRRIKDPVRRGTILNNVPVRSIELSISATFLRLEIRKLFLNSSRSSEP